MFDSFIFYFALISHVMHKQSIIYDNTTSKRFGVVHTHVALVNQTSY